MKLFRTIRSCVYSLLNRPYVVSAAFAACAIGGLGIGLALSGPTSTTDLMIGAAVVVVMVGTVIAMAIDRHGR